MFEALILLLTAATIFVAVAWVVVRDGIHHTEFERQQELRTRLDKALAPYRDFARAVASLVPSIEQAAEGFRKFGAAIEAAAAAEREWARKAREESP